MIDRRVCWRCGEVRALIRSARWPAMETCRECIDKVDRAEAIAAAVGVPVRLDPNPTALTDAP